MALYRSSLPKQKRRRRQPLVRCDRYVASSHGDVRGLEPLGTLDHVELDLRAFLQGAEAVGVDGAEVHEDILTSAGRDEAETLRVVEPLDRTVATHSENLLILCSCCTRGDSEALHLDPASHRLCNQQGSPPSHSTPIQMAPTTPAGEGSGGRQARRYLPLGVGGGGGAVTSGLAVGGAGKKTLFSRTYQPLPRAPPPAFPAPPFRST